MDKHLVEILACPIDKIYPLTLIDFQQDGEDIEEGVLLCAQCKRFFPITEGIPIMLPDEMRDKNFDLKFLKKWENKMSEVSRSAAPWHL